MALWTLIAVGWTALAISDGGILRIALAAGWWALVALRLVELRRLERSVPPDRC